MSDIFELKKAFALKEAIENALISQAIAHLKTFQKKTDTKEVYDYGVKVRAIFNAQAIDPQKLTTHIEPDIEKDIHIAAFYAGFTDMGWVAYVQSKLCLVK
jgi:hypothetical protein